MALRKLTSGVLTPAYGRNYKTAAEAQKDFTDGKDWKFALTGQYCSIRDFERGSSIELRYGPKYIHSTSVAI